MFETYVQETRAGQERRDREEIEGLKSEVSSPQTVLFHRSLIYRHCTQACLVLANYGDTIYIGSSRCQYDVIVHVQVQRLEEEMREREERWRAALARQRTRAESLEAQNRELQSDLRMMERERLVWWQEQVWNY